MMIKLTQTTLLERYLNIDEHQLQETLYILYIKPKMQLYAFFCLNKCNLKTYVLFFTFHSNVYIFRKLSYFILPSQSIFRKSALFLKKTTCMKK